MSHSISVLDDMHALVRSAASTAPPGSSVKACIIAASRRLGMTYARAKAHWYREARSVPAEEWIAAQEAQMRLRRERAAQLRAELAALEEMDRHAPVSLGGDDVRLDRRSVLECGGLVHQTDRPAEGAVTR